MQSNKRVYIEILRIFAIFLVLYCHTGVDGAYHYTVSGNSVSYGLAILMRCISLMCNMFFFMISGALLLPKEEKVSTVIVNRILKFVLVIIIFSMLQFLISYIKNPEMGFYFGPYLENIYTYPAITQYWYLYTYLGFLIVLVLLRAIVKGMEEKHYWYILAVYVLMTGILPIVERVCEFGNINLDVPMLRLEIMWPIIGYMVDKVAWERLYEKRAFIIMNVIGILALIINIHEMEIVYLATGKMQALDGLSILTVIAIYVDAKALCTKFTIPKVLGKVCVFIGSGVFGVYLFEPQLREMFHFIYYKTEPYITWFPATVLWLIPAILTGSLIMNVLKRIPVVKKLF